MAITWMDSPLIKKIKLPSGNEYYIADREAREKIESIIDTIAGGVSFNIVWTAADYASSTAPTAEKLAGIPEGIVVYYNNGASSATGTLDAGQATPGAFYLIYSATQTSEGPDDKYDEYVPVGSGSEKDWEKIGDTQIDLSNVVMEVTLNKQTANVIGASATLDTTKIKASASGAAISGVSGDNVTAVTGVSATKTNIKATASGANTAWNSKDTKTAVTGYTPSSATFGEDTFVKSVSAETGKNLVTTTVTGVQSSTTSVTGVQSSTTTASKSSASSASAITRASQTTADGTWTAINPSNTDANSNGNPDANENILANIGVSSEVLSIGACTLDTQTTYSVDSLSSVTFSDVTVPIKATSATTVPIKDSNATTVATGATSTEGTGDAVVTGVTVGSSASALTPTAVTGNSTHSVVTGLGTPSTASVIGASATFTVTQPTVALATGATAGTGVIEVATDASASSTDEVIGTGSSFTVTQPTVTISSGTTGDVTVATGTFSNKDQKTVLTSDTSITVTKGQ